jgi:hypothetical protein
MAVQLIQAKCTSLNISTNGLSKVCALVTTKSKVYADPIGVENGLWPLRCPQRNLEFVGHIPEPNEIYNITKQTNLGRLPFWLAGHSGNKASSIKLKLVLSLAIIVLYSSKLKIVGLLDCLINLFEILSYLFCPFELPFEGVPFSSNDTSLPVSKLVLIYLDTRTDICWANSAIKVKGCSLFRDFAQQEELLN